MEGAVAHWQMITKDPDGLARFYSDLFGWKFSSDNGLGYRTATTGGLDGGVWPAPPDAPEMVQLFVEVADIDAALARIEASGGKRLMPRQVLPDGDAMALAQDPLGRPFGLMTPRGE